jgi:hypothetical protein
MLSGEPIEEILMATATVSTATVPITTVEHPLRNPKLSPLTDLRHDFPAGRR